MRKLLFTAAVVLVAFALSSSHAGAVNQCCVSACGYSHAHGSATSTVSCTDSETKAFNNANPGCSICSQQTVTEHCTKSGSVWTGTADYNYICLTPCGLC